MLECIAYKQMQMAKYFFVLHAYLAVRIVLQNLFVFAELISDILNVFFLNGTCNIYE